MHNKIYNCFDCIKKICFSSKTSFFKKNNNTLVFKFNKNINKLDIFNCISKVFGVKIKKIRTLLVKRKKKINKKKIGYTKIWKKVYVILKKDQKIKLNDIFSV